MKRQVTAAVIAAMEEELELLRGRLEHAQTETVGGVRFDSGTIEGCPVVLCQCGIGKANAAAATALAIALYEPRAVINTGSAGALAAGLGVGDVVIGTRTAHHDADATAFGYARGQLPQEPLYFESDADLAALAKDATAFSGSMTEGLIVSGDAFVAGDAAAQVKAVFPDAVAVEMEAAAIAQICRKNQTPCVIIRAISDGADGGAAESFESFLKKAAAASAQTVSRILARLAT